MIDLFIMMHDVFSRPTRGYAPQRCWDAASTRAAPLLFLCTWCCRHSIPRRVRFGWASTRKHGRVSECSQFKC